jgi:cupin fold WbuC family metalloprotein
MKDKVKLIKKTADVYMAPGPIASIGQADIDYLRSELSGNAKGRVRINLHPDNTDSLHEMFIALRPDSYIRPHKHPNKSESFHVFYGEVDIVIFADDGSIKQIVSLAAGNPSKAFYYRMSKPYFHTLCIKSDFLVVHEITNGPFVKDGAIFADFAPAEDADASAIGEWHKRLSEHMRQAI